ncbi:ABC transporter permease [Enterococcus sp. DIV1444a]|uniref:ABC transporter permease n=1 Tax=Enterococcus sp. DIV1444a TaxID=2774679 RepID=UPI003F268455
MKKKLVMIIFFCFGLYYFLPLLGTVLYASSTSWGKTILPDDLTLKWISQLLRDQAFLLAVGRSLILAVLVLLLTLGLMIPTIIWIYLFAPRINQVMEKIVLLPYAIPGIILVTALLRTYSKTELPMFLVLVGALFINTLPIVFLGITNQMRLINLRELIDAAATLGASTKTVLFQVVFPNIRIGAILVSLMVFSSVFGEYMLTNLLIGGRFETVRIYMLKRMNENGHLASAVMVMYFLLMTVIAWATFVIANRQKKKSWHRKQHEIKQRSILAKEGVIVKNVLGDS